MAQGMKITKAGKAIDSAVLDDFYLHTSYPLLKVHSSGTFSTLIDGTRTISHNLGYKPFVLVFSEYVNDDGSGGVVLTSDYYQHDWYQGGATITFFGYTKIFTDRIEITIGNTNSVTPGAVDGIYYIFKDEVV